MTSASKAFPIPVRAIGPGSQPGDDAPLDVMPMPGPLQVFEMPHVPERVDPQVMLASAARLQRLLDALDARAAPGAGAGLRVALDDLSPAVLEVTNQVLGDGEVSIRVEAQGERPALHVQESVFAGLWRCGELNEDGSLARYWLEAGPMPAAVLRAASETDAATRAAAAAALADPLEWPAGTMNGQALLAELRARVAAHAAGESGGQINLSLLPLSPADRTLIAHALPPGPLSIISRGFGNCHVGSTAVPGVWRQQYFNSMKTLILDLIEITTMPEVATASDDDLHDSRERLAELLRWMRESAAIDSAGAAADEPATH